MEVWDHGQSGLPLTGAGGRIFGVEGATEEEMIGWKIRLADLSVEDGDGLRHAALEEGMFGSRRG